LSAVGPDVASRQKDAQEKDMNSADPVRRLGRPDQQASEELVRHIVDTATRLFVGQGYAATSIEQIAAAAGSGKQTIYRRFTSKEGLFTEVINEQGRRLFEVAEASGATGSDPTGALKEACRQLFDFVLAPDTVQLHRILVAEVVRFPELGEQLLSNCLGPFKAMLKRLLQAAMDAGRIRNVDPDFAHALLTSLLTGFPIQRALLGREPFASPDERDAYFEEGWALFIRGMGVDRS
jgi:AcrR family transcriptional regulator